MGWQYVNKICPKCGNANYVVSLEKFSKKFPYKCLNCLRYLTEKDFVPMQNECEITHQMDDLKKAIIHQIEKSEAEHPADLVHEILILLYTKGYEDGTKYMTVREDGDGE